MSNPRPYGVPGEQGTPWPQYGQDGTMPAQGGYPGAAYAGPAVMPPMNLPSRAPGTIMIVLGLLMMLIIAPVIFAVVAFSGLNTETPENVNAVSITNGGTVEVGANGQYTILLGEAEATSCTMTDTDGDVYDMHTFAGVNNYYTATDLPAGTYRIDCEGLPAGADIAGMDVSAGDITKSSTNGLIWSSVVGVSGTIIMIIGIVLVVKANGRRREIRQQAMMSAIG
jgi:putative membrane protein